MHIGVDPLFYLKGWSPYCLDLIRLQEETAGAGVDRWVVFPFVSYFALEMGALQRGGIEITHEGDSIPYRIEDRRLLEDLARLEPDTRQQSQRRKNFEILRAALDAEVRAEQEKDRIYWEPLKKEMEAFRRAERNRKRCWSL